MAPRSFWIAAAALLIAAAALPVAIVAVVRAGGSSAPASSSMGGMAMQGTGMSEHMAAAPTDGVPDATAKTGGSRLAPRMEDGVYVFDLVARPVRWEILPGVRVTAWSYNGIVPGPELRVPYGARVRVDVKNELPAPTTVHWHGIAVPNAMDGVPGITQEPIAQGARFTYAFTAIPAGRDSKGGTFMYHSHYDEDRQVGLGLSGALIIDPPAAGPRYDVERTLLLAEWSLDRASGATRPPMEMEGMLPNYFTINGKSFPATETIRVRRGQRVLLRLVGAGQFVHPMHLHGTDFRIVAKDGHPVSGTPQAADVVQVAPGERVDIAFTATEPGKWILHCHIGHHLTNNGELPGGLTLVVDVTPGQPHGGSAPAQTTIDTSSSAHQMPDGSTMGGMDMDGTGSK